MDGIETAVDMKVCSVYGCGKPVKAKKLCSTHHQQWRRTGFPVVIPKEPKPRKYKCIRRGCKNEGKLELERFCDDCFKALGIAYSRRRQGGQT